MVYPQSLAGFRQLPPAEPAYGRGRLDGLGAEGTGARGAFLGRGAEMLALGLLDECLDPQGILLAVAVAGDGVGAAGGFDEDVRPEQARVDPHARHALEVDDHMLTQTNCVYERSYVFQGYSEICSYVIVNI